MEKDKDGNEINEEKKDASADQISQMSDMIELMGGGKEKDDDSGLADDEELDADGNIVKKKTADNTDKKADEGSDETPREKALREELEELKAKLEAKLETEKKPDVKAEESIIVDEESLKKQVDDIQKDLVSEYVKDDKEFDEIVESREKFNNMLKAVRGDGIQAVLRTLPKVITGMVSQQVMIYQKTAEFYGKNPDLKDHGKLVGTIIDEAASKNPDWSLDKVLEYVGGDGTDNNQGEVRKRLGLKKKALEKTSDDNDKTRRKQPNTDRAAHVRQPGDGALKLVGIEKEISEMLTETEF